MQDHTPETRSDLYTKIVAYEDAANAVGVQTISTQGAYRQLTDAIGGRGDLAEAQARFALEFPILGVMHEDWKQAALAVSAAVADSLPEWEQSIVIPLRQVAHVEEPPPGIGDYKQPYGERHAIGTRLLDCE